MKREIEKHQEVREVDGGDNTVPFANEKAEKSQKHIVMKYALIILTIILLSTVSYISYFLLVYKKADQIILETAETYEYTDEGDWYFFPAVEKEPKTAIFLYQSAAIDRKAYFYFANTLQRKGFDVVISKSWFNQPLLNTGILNDVIEAYPDIESWYIGGHGTGAVAVDRYLSKNDRTEIKGAFYLGAVPSDEQLKKSLPVIIAIGTEDGIFDRTKLENTAERKIPSWYDIYILDGGNYTNFGYYALEKGDNKAKISVKSQQDIVSNKLKEWIKRIEAKTP